MGSKTWKGSLGKSKLRLELSQFSMLRKTRRQVWYTVRVRDLNCAGWVLNPRPAEGLSPGEMAQKPLPISRAQAALPWLLLLSPLPEVFTWLLDKSLADICWQLFGQHWKHHMCCPARSLPPIRMGWRSSRGLRSAWSLSSRPPLLTSYWSWKFLKDLFYLSLLKTFQGFFNLKANTDIYILFKNLITAASDFILSHSYYNKLLLKANESWRTN